MVKAPHWLDSVVGDSWEQGPDAVVEAIASSRELKTAAKIGVEAAKKVAARYKENPAIKGESPAQAVRDAVVWLFDHPEGE